MRVRGETNDNPHLKDELVNEELSGILNFALAGLKELRNVKLATGRDVFPILAAGKDILENHRGLCDSVRGMANEHLVSDARGYIQTKELYRLYKNYCAVNGLTAKGKSNFEPGLRRIFPSIEHTRKLIDGQKVFVRLGIRKRDDESAVVDSADEALL